MKNLVPLAALTFVACLAFPLHSHAIIDLDPADGLDDIWQEYYGAQSLAPGDDEDSDGYSNLDECTAGTDPFDPASHLEVQNLGAPDDSDTASITFSSERGISYMLQVSTDLTDTGMTDLPTVYRGTGGDLTVTLSADSVPSSTGAIAHDLWSDIDPLSDIDVFPTTPDGTENVPSLKSPTNVADNYVGRMRGWLVPDRTGLHTFTLAAHGTAELRLGTNDDPATATAAVASTGSITMAPEEWDHPDASTHMANLTAGQRYYIEVRHQHGTGADHCAVGWTPPGSSSTATIGGKNLVPWSTSGSATTSLAGAERMFFRVIATDQDQDGDSITDWAEIKMGGDGNFFFADGSSTSSGLDDLTTVTNALAGGGQTVTLAAADTEANEDDRSGSQVLSDTPIGTVPADQITFRLDRTGSLQPLTIQYTLGSTGGQSSTPVSGTDFSEEDLSGNPISGTLILPFGQVSTKIVLTPFADGIHEYPEQVRFTIIDAGGPGGGDYDVGTTFQTDATIYDARDIPEQDILFVGRSSEDPAHENDTKGTAIVSGFLNGRKDHMRLNSLIMAPFSSPQNDSHIHKANPGPLNGPIIYEITEIPGDSVSGPKIGELLDYPWPIEDIQGASTGTQIIDGLFGQNSETPVYLNWHTNDNQAGELWAIFGEEPGSIAEPDPPATPPGTSPLAGAALERDVRRFLNQATFGATDSEVAALLNEIATTHASAPVPRIAAFEAWIDDQINNIPQTYFVDYVHATDNQEWKLRGYFDPARWFTNVGNIPSGDPIAVPTLPSAWPTIDRSRPDPNEWFPTQDFPLTRQQINWGRNEDDYTFFDLGEVDSNNRRRAHWMFMANAGDQLRQKMGYSLQQILVVSETLTRIRLNHIAAANYQDMLNHHAFDHFHDLFAFVNRSPIMGKWLSSLKNQKAFDINGDGIPDVFPDENLAREDMQLFSIGLFNLWTDGTLKLSEETGLPEPTYLNNDITEFARVLTGQSFSRYANSPAEWGIVSGVDNGDPFDTNNGNGGILFNQNNPTGGNASNRFNTVRNAFRRNEGNRYYGHQFNYPMQMFADFHDLGVKTIAGGKVIDNTGLSDGDVSQSGGRADEIAHAEKDLDDAITWLAGKPGDGLPDYDMVTSHRSTPAFIALRLIQRFTTSNPSTGYLYRVAKSFKDSEGGMTETLKAILLDYEVRELAVIDNGTTAGIKKPPLDLYLQLLRNFSQRFDTSTSTFTEGSYSESPIDASRPVPGGVATAPPADGYIVNFGYPAAQASSFTTNSQYRYFNTDPSLGMTPFSQETVFNFYLPLFSPGGPVADAGMVAPELQIATETTVIQNVNFFRPLNFFTTGQSTNSIGGNPGRNAAGMRKNGNYNQRLLYGDATPDDAHESDNYDNVRIALEDWALNVIPWGTSSADRLDDVTALIDAIDLRLTGGTFLASYDYDPSDNEDATADGINPSKTTYGDGDLTNDGELKNPREIIIDSLVGTTSFNPYSSNSNSARNARINLFRTALYLMSSSPGFAVQK